jgi:N-acetylglucosaminyldiphosphoundecaprenol N-acetyl-beta-D-mannosaminyltransferase
MKVEVEKRWPSFRVLGVRVDAVQIPEVIAQMEQWIQERSYGHYIVAANAHVVMESHQDPAVRKAVQAAEIVLPDGMPLVLIARRRGMVLRGRATGPALMRAVWEDFRSKAYRHYFYGGLPSTREALLDRLHSRWPPLPIAGAYAPPFRALTPQEDREVVRTLNESQADVLWVGLGCPKQELWMCEHQRQLKVPVMVGVGQAFDLLAGVRRAAPPWMSEHGLEWLFRLSQEPRRLWKRYLLQGPMFLYRVMREELRLKHDDE